MQVKGKMDAELVGFHVKWNKSNDGKEASADFDIPVSEDQATSRFGEDFATLAFSTMRVVEGELEDEGDTIGHLVDTVKPGKRVVFEKHVVKIYGHEVHEQPQMLNVKTVDGERKVIVRMRVPIEVSKSGLVQYLVSQVGQCLKIEFDPSQASFEFRTKVANGHAAAVA